MIACIIIEDEPLAMQRTKSYVQKVPVLDLLAVFDNGIDALSFLNTNDVDLIFLDIQMAELTGIHLLETGNIQAQVIITTAYPEFALKGFDLKVADYLLKPFSFERFVQAVNRVQQQAARPTEREQPGHFFVKTAYRLERVLLQEVLFIEGMRDYRRIVTPAKKIMTLQTFKEFELNLPSDLVCRVHKSYMVSICNISSVEKDMIRVGGYTIPVSETFRKNFYALIGK